ncbi:hypothetical protein [Rhodohalobacter sp. 614A]|uniref:hypothetical protein n=1 Tax=Rhodohalobacter sp. 614A TaxID=2908649 RepID=UPI001F436B74|nr:hypothetical protein [Rhodohalobacter sp. 614A]
MPNQGKKLPHPKSRFPALYRVPAQWLFVAFVRRKMLRRFQRDVYQTVGQIFNKTKNPIADVNDLLHIWIKHAYHNIIQHIPGKQINFLLHNGYPVSQALSINMGQVQFPVIGKYQTK